MTHVFWLEFRLICVKWKRITAFICLAALLCSAAGLLGNRFLYGDKALDPISILLVNEDNSPQGALFIHAFLQNDKLKGSIIFLEATRGEADAALQNGTVSAVVLLPEGFTESIITGENRPFQIFYNSATPLRSAMIRSFSQSYMLTLQSSQLGVYSVLEYIHRHYPERYEDTILPVNLRYLSAVFSRDSLLLTEELSATGGGILGSYVAGAYLFLMLLGGVLFCDRLQLLSPAILCELRRRGIGGFSVCSGQALAVSALYGVVSLLLAGLFYLGMGLAGLTPPAISPWLAAAVLPVLLFAGVFTVLSASLFSGSFSGSLWIAFCSLSFLFLSGGILPLVFLAPPLRAAGQLTFQYWASELLRGTALGAPPLAALWPCLGWIAALWLLTTVLLARRGKAAAK